MITTVIFDLDGLVADTEPLHCRAYQEVLRSQGAVLTEDEYLDHWVRAGRGIAEWVVEKGLGLDPIRLRAGKSRRYLELLATSLRPMDGIFALLESLHGNKTLALASSSYRDAVDGVLEGLRLARYFETIVSGSEVARVKPAPDIFLEAARRLGADPSQCVVVEDAEKGVLAAHRAGMRSIAVPNDYTLRHDFSRATRICASLGEINLELIDKLDRAR